MLPDNLFEISSYIPCWEFTRFHFCIFFLPTWSDHICLVYGSNQCNKFDSDLEIFLSWHDFQWLPGFPCTFITSCCTHTSSSRIHARIQENDKSILLMEKSSRIWESSWLKLGKLDTLHLDVWLAKCGHSPYSLVMLWQLSSTIAALKSQPAVHGVTPCRGHRLQWEAPNLELCSVIAPPPKVWLGDTQCFLGIIYEIFFFFPLTLPFLFTTWGEFVYKKQTYLLW